MSINTKPNPIAVVTPEVTNPDGVKAVYANNMGLAGTLTDVQLIFTHMRQGSGADGKLQPENAVSAMVVIPIAQIGQMVSGLTAILQHHTNLVQAGPQTQNPEVKN